MRRLLIAFGSCAGIVTGILDAMHVSRSIEARRVLRDRRHLLDDGCGALSRDLNSIRKRDISHADEFDTEPCGYWSSSFERG